ncbi:MAG: large-conductance mechanosensitive channel protein MscL [Alphaproteobacteria bacterium]|nr:large-conductance mechanosensitive channel protein MscL [Alphaproteobacteria bacterium]
MVDMAVGIVIGAAFAGIVSSLVDDVIMPPIGLLLGGVDFSELFLVLKSVNDGRPLCHRRCGQARPVTWNLGLFINALVKFVIVAFALFIVVKGVNRLRKQEEAAPAAPPAPSREQVLLEEIRDLLKAR